MPTYASAVQREIEAAGECWGPLSVSTVYVGGGTPSLLPIDLLADLISTVRATFDVSDAAEVTVEVNPGTVTEPYLCALHSLGVDRLSIGVQSAHDEELQMLGRMHRWDDAVCTVGAARRAGFEQLNLDLIFGLPGQLPDGWRDTLKKALGLRPEHLSLYDLSVEEGTPLAERIAGGELADPDERCAVAMYEFAEEELAGEGFFHYEISSWARAAQKSSLRCAHWWPEDRGSGPAPKMSEEISPFVCRHNLSYWRNDPWLGVGAGAHSWMTGDLLRSGSGPPLERPLGKRWANPYDPQDYVTGVNQGDILASLYRHAEPIDCQLEMGETMMLGLRLAEGVTRERFAARFGVGLADVFGHELNDLHHLGLLKWDETAARLTARGRLLGNRVFERFI